VATPVCGEPAVDDRLFACVDDDERQLEFDTTVSAVSGSDITVDS